MELNIDRSPRYWKAREKGRGGKGGLLGGRALSWPRLSIDLSSSDSSQGLTGRKDVTASHDVVDSSACLGTGRGSRALGSWPRQFHLVGSTNNPWLELLPRLGLSSSPMAWIILRLSIIDAPGDAC